MTAALTWLNDLIQWFGRWVPRLVLIAPTHRGVRFGPRGGAKAVGPGLVIYWPITHSLIEVPVTLQSVPLCGQLLPLKDDISSVVPRCGVCAITVQFNIHDPVKAATRTLHFQALVSNRAQAMVARHWPGHVDSDLQWLERAKQALDEEMGAFGLHVTELDVTSVGVGAALKNIHDWNYADHVNGKRPE